MQDEISVNFEEADFVDAYRPHPRSRRMRSLVLLLAVMLVALIVVLLVRFPSVHCFKSLSNICKRLRGGTACGYRSMA